LLLIIPLNKKLNKISTLNRQIYTITIKHQDESENFCLKKPKFHRKYPNQQNFKVKSRAPNLRMQF